MSSVGVGVMGGGGRWSASARGAPYILLQRPAAAGGGANGAKTLRTGGLRRVVGGAPSCRKRRSTCAASWLRLRRAGRMGGCYSAPLAARRRGRRLWQIDTLWRRLSPSHSTLAASGVALKGGGGRVVEIAESGLPICTTWLAAPPLTRGRGNTVHRMGSDRRQSWALVGAARHTSTRPRRSRRREATRAAAAAATSGVSSASCGSRSDP